MRVLVLGGYGVIGSAVVRQLAGEGHEVFCLGRNAHLLRRMKGTAGWIAADLSRLRDRDTWLPVLARCQPDAIVNAAGALQDGLRDQVAAVQSEAMCALYLAAAEQGVERFVQISAPGASCDAGTIFMKTKGEADLALSQSEFDWTILRPGLVLGPEAYGGTALLRAIAGMPFVRFDALAERPVQTVSVADVAAAVGDVLAGRVKSRATYDLVEQERHTLGEVSRALGAWLGVRHRLVVPVPLALLRLGGWLGDAAGWLGWRAPFRSTTITELGAGIVGDPEAWRRAGGRRMASLGEVLEQLPSTVQERWFARMFLLKPLLVVGLAGFWLATAGVALANIDAAAGVLAVRGVDAGVARALVIAGSLVDVSLGTAILVRKWVVPAAIGMIATTLVYLGAGTVLASDLWADPLGPFVKAVPVILLALVAMALSEDR